MTLPLGSFLEKKAKNIFWSMASSRLVPGKKAPPREFVSSVLLIRPDRLGDFLLSVPAFQALRKSLGPSCRFTLVAGERNASLARFFFPEAEVLTFHRGFFRRPALYFRLWRGTYDLAVDFHSYPFSTTSALMTLLSKAPSRVGFWATGDFAQYRGLSRKVFNQGREAPPENLPETEKGFLLLRGIVQRPPLRSLPKVPPVPRAVRERVEAFFREAKAGPRDFCVGIHPTLQKDDNRWSQGKYLELVRELGKDGRVKVFVVHGKGEGELLERFKLGLEGFSNVFILPESDVLFILEAAKRFRLFICNDSGLMHLASLATRVLAVFGPSEPRRWGPLATGKAPPIILRKKDGLCDSVPSREVVREVRKLLKSKR